MMTLLPSGNREAYFPRTPGLRWEPHASPFVSVGGVCRLQDRRALLPAVVNQERIMPEWCVAQRTIGQKPGLIPRFIGKLAARGIILGQPGIPSDGMNGLE